VSHHAVAARTALGEAANAAAWSAGAAPTLDAAIASHVLAEDAQT
jgi:hypothetical protein